MKTCPKCNETKDESEFPAYTGGGFNFATKIYNKPCKRCNASAQKEWRIRNKGKQSSQKIKRVAIEDRPWMSAVRTRLKNARARTKIKSGIEVTVSEEYLWDLLQKQHRKCALTNAELTLERGHPMCLSLDQINPAKGYIEGNVQWVCWCVNFAKGELSMLDFVDMCRAVVQEHGHTNYALS